MYTGLASKFRKIPRLLSHPNHLHTKLEVMMTQAKPRTLRLKRVSPLAYPDALNGDPLFTDEIGDILSTSMEQNNSIVLTASKYTSGINIVKQIGPQLDEKINQSGLSNDQVSRLAGCSPSRVWKLRSIGNNRVECAPSDIMLGRILELALGLDQHVIFINRSIL